MTPIPCANREDAVDSALALLKKHLVQGEDEACLKVYQAIGALSLFKVNGKKRTVVARFEWKP